MTKEAAELLKGNVCIAEAAVRAGLEAYFGYPITPQTELLEHLAARMPALGRVFVQAESEVAVINMVYGAACAGARTMTSSSSPGVSLMQEGFSYIAASDVPTVVVDMMRGGPGLGNIQPAQGDYFQVTRSAGHGDYRPIVLAPASVQEAIDLTILAFDLADKYRHLVLLVADGLIGQMMEPAVMPPMRPIRERPAWAVTGKVGREKNVITSITSRQRKTRRATSASRTGSRRSKPPSSARSNTRLKMLVCWSSGMARRAGLLRARSRWRARWGCRWACSGRSLCGLFLRTA